MMHSCVMPEKCSLCMCVCVCEHTQASFHVYILCTFSYNSFIYNSFKVTCFHHNL
jgi:hypothetical protein